MTHNSRGNYEKVARITHLYEAATVLATPSSDATTPNPELARIYLNSARLLAKKIVMSMDPSIKRTICKRCDSLLIPGVSATHEVENKSKNGNKPWADVLIVGCKACGALKRYPVGAGLLKEKKGKKYQMWSECRIASEAAVAAGKGKGGKGGKNGQQQKQQAKATPPPPTTSDEPPVTQVESTDTAAPTAVSS